jgi:sn-glycerol 3-phosphate transport system substrate-binding protein
MFISPIKRTLGAAAIAMCASTAALAEDVELQFYFPVAVGGAAADTIQALTDEYVANNPGVKIDAVYAGSYQDTVAKVLTAARGGDAPQLSVILSVDMFTLLDEDLILPFDDFATTAEDKEWLNSFYPSFMENSRTGGKTYGIPFQRSTPVLYWNKEAFKEAGLDPDTPPATWEEMVEMARSSSKRTPRVKLSAGACAYPVPASPIGCSRVCRLRTTSSWPTMTATRPISTIRKWSRRCNTWSTSAESTA